MQKKFCLSFAFEFLNTSHQRAGKLNKEDQISSDQIWSRVAFCYD